jgi:hypothetical protein
MKQTLSVWRTTQQLYNKSRVNFRRSLYCFLTCLLVSHIQAVSRAKKVDSRWGAEHCYARMVIEAYLQISADLSVPGCSRQSDFSRHACQQVTSTTSAASRARSNARDLQCTRRPGSQRTQITHPFSHGPFSSAFPDSHHQRKEE